MSKILTVAVREFIETVKTKTFIISSLLLPMLIVGLMLGTEHIATLAEKQERPVRTLALLDAAGVGGALQEVLERHNEEQPRRRYALEPEVEQVHTPESLRQRVDLGEIYGFIHVPQEAVSADAPAEIGTRDGQLETQKQIQRLVERAIVAARFARADPPIDYGQIQYLQRPVPMRSIDVKTGQDTSGTELIRFMTPFAFMFFMFMGTLNISQGLLTSLIEEKSSRVVEVLLSAVSPTQLMAGKILGMVAVGSLLMAIWAGFGYFAADARGMGYLVQPYQLQYLALYFLPGFLLTSAILAAIGSACNTLKEAQSLAFPITLITIVPMMLWWQIAMNPTSTFSVVLSYIPPITPFIMILRICADPQTPMLQIVTTLALLWASVFVAIWAAGRIFRIGVLMYGKPPTPGELLRWVRYS